jgi:phosphoribosylformylglycinamidine synthase
MEKKLVDVLLMARDRGLFNAITDCGAGGFSSAVGEMGAELGAEVHLDRAPLKYEGLSYTEIWISESQERMVLAVPPEKWPELHQLCASEDVEANAIGSFNSSGQLRLYYQGQQVADLNLRFLHDGRPPVVRKALYNLPPIKTAQEQRSQVFARSSPDYTQDLLRILSSLNVCSKEWVIRQYDHEVQGGCVVKPLVGVRSGGPSDAAVIAPVLGSARGLAIGCGINPRYGDQDPYPMAASAIDEAVRNVVAVGADPNRIALLDNFCWGNTERPEVLGSLVRAAEACRDVAMTYGTPFISGKDSLNNEFHAGDVHIAIPPTLLISALGYVPDVRKCLTMDLKKAGNLLYLIGWTSNEMGGSHFHFILGLAEGQAPFVNRHEARKVFRSLHRAILQGFVVSCHDLSEGGLAVALAEMCFSGGLGAQIDCQLISKVWDEMPDEVILFSESNTRFLLEVAPDKEAVLLDILENTPLFSLGCVTTEDRLVVSNSARAGVLIDAPIADLRAAWQQPLQW